MPKKTLVADNYLAQAFDQHMMLHYPVLRVMSPHRTAEMRHTFYEGAASILSGLAEDDNEYVKAVLIGAQREIDEHTKSKVKL